MSVVVVLSHSLVFLSLESALKNKRVTFGSKSVSDQYPTYLPLTGGWDTLLHTLKVVGPLVIYLINSKF